MAGPTKRLIEEFQLVLGVALEEVGLISVLAIVLRDVPERILEPLIQALLKLSTWKFWATNFKSALANFAFVRQCSHWVGTNSVGRNAGVVKARVSAADSMGRFLLGGLMGEGEIACRSSPDVRRRLRLLRRSGVAGRGRERRFDRGNFGELLVELGLKRERDAEARLEATAASRRLRDHASHLGEVRLRSGQRVSSRETSPSGVRSVSHLTASSARRAR